MKPSLDEAWMFCKLGFNQFAEQQGRRQTHLLVPERSTAGIHEIIQLRAEQKPSGDVTVTSPVFVKVDVLAPPSRVFFFFFPRSLVKVLLLLLL